MPRPERPLDPDDGAVQRFAGELRELRRRAGRVTYRQLADRSGYAVTTLSEAAGGKRLPTLDVALAYAMACGGDEQEWTAKWRAAALTAAELRCSAGKERPPYRGLRSFRAEDADLFFGREQLVADVVRLVSEHPVTVLTGPSGSGKTSLVMAGVLPALCPSLRPVVVTPGERLPEDSAGLVVVDQFEELYTRFDASERDEFLGRILARDRSLLCVRADFAARLAEYPQVVVGQVELDAAVTKPALAVGLSVERALLVTVVNEAAGQIGALPLLSHALLETWRRRRGEVLTLAGSHALSGATVYLMRASSNRKCVVTIKTASVGTATLTAAWVGDAVDVGNYRYYAGPVKQQQRCVIWGGRHGNSIWERPTPYCN